VIIAGLDLSLTGAGVVILDTKRPNDLDFHLVSSPAPARVPTPGHKGKKKDAGIQPVWDRAARLRKLARSIVVKVPAYADIVAIEAPSFASKFGSPHERSGLWWMVATMMDPYGQLVEIPPSSRALYATGDGRADKPKVVAHAVPRYLLPFKNNNIVDAYVLAEMAAHAAGHPTPSDLPDHNATALRNVLWPFPLKGNNE
jgi:crossover junction endodeoxyribonuclease RuvC